MNELLKKNSSFISNKHWKFNICCLVYKKIFHLIVFLKYEKCSLVINLNDDRYKEIAIAFNFYDIYKLIIFHMIYLIIFLK